MAKWTILRASSIGLKLFGKAETSVRCRYNTLTTCTAAVPLVSSNHTPNKSRIATLAWPGVSEVQVSPPETLVSAITLPSTPSPLADMSAPSQQKHRGCREIAAAKCEQNRQASGKERQAIVEQSQHTARTCASASNRAHSFILHRLILPHAACAHSSRDTIGTELLGYPAAMPTASPPRRLRERRTCASMMILNAALATGTTPWLMLCCILDAWHKSPCAVGLPQMRRVPD